MALSTFPILNIAPAQVMRGSGVLAESGSLLARLGNRPLLVGGNRALATAMPLLSAPLSAMLGEVACASHRSEDNSLEGNKLQDGGLPVTGDRKVAHAWPTSLVTECSESTLVNLHTAAIAHDADVIIGIGGGKALDAAKLLAYQRQLPVVTVPTSAATCAGWTALSNVYSDEGAFLYDVTLPHCPDLIVLDYDLVATAPSRTLLAGIGDALAKWYEASVSSGHSPHTMIIGAVQQARVLRDILFQRSAAALNHPGGEDWREVVDAAVLMAGVIGGLGGAQCRTVAAHAIHNGLTHVAASSTLHGEKVAYGILVQLRLEEMLGTSQALAATSRQQLLQFYTQLGLPRSLADLGMAQLSVAQLAAAATVACQPGSDIHHLPFAVQCEQVMAAMVSTTATTMPTSSTTTPTAHLLAAAPSATV